MAPVCPEPPAHSEPRASAVTEVLCTGPSREWSPLTGAGIPANSQSDTVWAPLPVSAALGWGAWPGAAPLTPCGEPSQLRYPSDFLPTAGGRCQPLSSLCPFCLAQCGFPCKSLVRLLFSWSSDGYSGRLLCVAFATLVWFWGAGERPPTRLLSCHPLIIVILIPGITPSSLPLQTVFFSHAYFFVAENDFKGKTTCPPPVPRSSVLHWSLFSVRVLGWLGVLFPVAGRDCVPVRTALAA